MKKLLLIGTLVLAIGSSIISGTTARYTQDLGEKTAVVTTKTFNVNATFDDQFTDFEISPKKGEDRKEFNFLVKNYDVIGGKQSASEVDLDVKFVLDISDLNQSGDINELIKLLNIHVKSNGNEFKIQKVKNNINNGEATIEGTASFKAGESADKNFSIEVKWNGNNEGKWKAAQGDKVGMKLKVNAIQAN